jgi:acylphosphatase
MRMSETGGQVGSRRPGGRLGAVEVLVEGHVQGVGYRNFAQRRAQERRLTGYAMNLPDGRVKIRAEGDVQAIDRFVRELGAGPPLARIARVDVSAVPFSGRYQDFGIRFSEER